MKKIKITYWILTVLLAVFMVISSVPDMLSVPQAVDLVSRHLGYPVYFLPFIGVAKLLGVVAILIPGFPRIKEWVYAGFIYDLTAAAYSSIAVGDPASTWLPVLVIIIFVAVCYMFHHKKLKAASHPDLNRLAPASNSLM